MTPRERVLAALNLEKLDRPPVGIVTQSATIDQMNAVGVSWPEAHSDPQLMAKLAAAATDLGLETIRIPFDLTAEAELFGASVDLGKVDRTPMLKAHPFDSESEPVIPEDPHQGRPGVVIEATKILKEQYGKEYPIVVGIAGPFTLAGHLVETGNLLLWCITEPDTVKKFVQAATDFEVKYVKALIEAGADVIVIVDPSKFVPRRTALEQGLHKYADLNRLAAGVVAPGGMMITCSCSGPVDPATFVETVGRAARSANRTMQIFRQTGAGPDHPYHADTPEGQYLKVVWSRLI